MVSRLVFSKRKRYSSYKTNASGKDMKGQLLNKMLVLATNAHADQYDKGGNPYILHPLKVMHYLETNDVELQCIALGHDIIEDTKVTYADLRDQGFTARIIEGIRCLTKAPGETYEEYKFRVFSNEDAMRVKLCDLRHNTDVRRLKGVTDGDIARTVKYHVFYLEIMARLPKIDEGES
jgi:(p)ppGpp synthase/HD superfamily hydrolase